MSLFDSIINGTAEKFDLGDKAADLLAALLSLMTDEKSGGFRGFIKRFDEAGLGDLANSWITSGENQTISGEQLESALGEKTIKKIAKDIDISADTAKSAMAYMLPQVVDKLTPDGEIPDNEVLQSKIGGAFAGGAATSFGAAAGGVTEDVKENLAEMGDVAGEKVSEAIGSALEGNDESILKWLLPLLLLGLLVILGFWFCSKSEAPKPAVNTNQSNTSVNAVNSAQ